MYIKTDFLLSSKLTPFKQFYEKNAMVLTGKTFSGNFVCISCL